MPPPPRRPAASVATGAARPAQAEGRDLDPLLLFSVLGLLLTKSLGLLDLPPEKAEAYLETVLRHVARPAGHDGDPPLHPPSS